MNRIFWACCIVAAATSTLTFLWPTGRLAEAATGRGMNSEAGCRDEDGDGYGLGCAEGPDCNDWDATVNPGESEVCNFRDDDCDALVDNDEDCEAPAIDSSPVIVGAGDFTMGSDQGAEDERPVHRIFLSTVAIDRHEVTNRRYAECVNEGECEPPMLLTSHRRNRYYDHPEFADYPVVFVSWHQGAAFCRYAGGRLPTEAEWEKAARGDATTERTFPWGEAPPSCSLANMGGAGSCVGDTDRVGRRLEGRSPYGALDMAGNVWEWVSDWYDPRYYDISPTINPIGPAQGRLKVMRGGCWRSGADSLRVSCRKAELQSTWGHNVGFRCAYPKGE